MRDVDAELVKDSERDTVDTEGLRVGENDKEPLGEVDGVRRCDMEHDKELRVVDAEVDKDEETDAEEETEKVEDVDDVGVAEEVWVPDLLEDSEAEAEADEDWEGEAEREREADAEKVTVVKDGEEETDEENEGLPEDVTDNVAEVGERVCDG